jgi:hypothetical protein
VINLAWGGLTNGHINTNILVDVSGREDYLEPTAAAQWLRMRAACLAATGVVINPAPGSSCYRPYVTQVEFYNLYQQGKGNVAAYPGTSNHGWGRAIDLTGYESSAAVWNWLQSNASTYGYSWATGQASGERWHWECLTAPGTIINAPAVVTVKPITDAPKPRKKKLMDYALIKSSADATVWLYRLSDGAFRGLKLAEYQAIVAQGIALSVTTPDALSAAVNAAPKW